MIGRIRLGLLVALVVLGRATPGRAQRIAVISDLNGSYGSARYGPVVTTAIRALVQLRPDLVIITGDMVAGQRQHPPLRPDAIAAMWRAFHAAVTGPLEAAGIPVAVTPGNHDASAYPGYGAERMAFRAEWDGRGARLRLVDRGQWPFYYAFAVGDILLISLDMTTVSPLDSSQRNWLGGVLATEGPRFRHRITFGHVPIHPFTVGRESEVTADSALETLLASQGVELHLSGHHHAFYIGSHEGIRFVSQAALGGGPRPLLGTRTPSPRAITLIEPGTAGALTVRAVTGPAFDQPLDLSRLPARVGVLSREGTAP